MRTRKKEGIHDKNSFTTIDGRGDPDRPAPKQSAVTATHYSLDDASRLLQLPAKAFKSDETANIRGAAAVLAEYAKNENNGQLPADINGWYSAIVDFSGSTDTNSGQAFADDIYVTMQTGIAAKTADGQVLSIAPTPGMAPRRVMPHGLTDTFAAPQARGQNSGNVDCPATLNCRFIPAAYAANSSDPSDYGNYDPANRPQDMKIKYIVIHDTEGSYTSAINHFQDPTSYVSCNYVIRSSDGAITEMVRPSDVSWCAGDWYVNMHSINIEHEGIASQGATWYTEAMYKSSATLVRWLADKYDIPLDRQHILGHDNIPALSTGVLTGQHWDPGPYWDWNHYMELLRHPNVNGSETTKRTKVVTIAPTFATNQQQIQDCSTGTCVQLPAQGSNLVYLHTQPNNASPLLTNLYLHPEGEPGTTVDSDWSATVSAGQTFAVAAQQGDWMAIWYGSQIGWFYNPRGSRTAYTDHTRVITPKAGVASVPVYGGAYPETTAYPADVPARNLVTLYTIPSGQSYVAASGTLPTDYFYDATINFSLPNDHIIVRGKDKFYQISYNHRMAYVKVNDVDVRYY